MCRLVDKLREEKNSSYAYYMTFLIEYKKDNKFIYIFHEGKDDPSFYTNFLEQKMARHSFIFINCKNKDGVYQLYNLIDWSHFAKNQLLFFVDKDYSDLLKINYPQSDNIFVTTYYSIENYIVSVSMLKRICRELLGITKGNEINDFLELYNQAYDYFKLYMRRITAWILCQKRCRKNIILRDVDLSKIFNIVDGKIECKITTDNIFEYLKQITQVESPISITDNIWEEYCLIRSIDECKIYIRGKFELWFFCNEITSLINYFKSIGRKYKMPYNFSVSTAVGLLAPRVCLPPDLDFFLTNVQSLN